MCIKHNIQHFIKKENVATLPCECCGRPLINGGHYTLKTLPDRLLMALSQIRGPLPVHLVRRVSSADVTWALVGSCSSLSLWKYSNGGSWSSARIYCQSVSKLFSLTGLKCACQFSNGRGGGRGGGVWAQSCFSFLLFAFGSLINQTEIVWDGKAPDFFFFSLTKKINPVRDNKV